MKAKEIYVSKGNVMGATFVLMIMDDGTPILIWYMGNCKVNEKSPIIVKNTNGSMMIEYGAPNILGARQTLPFTNKNGELEERWIRIK